MREFIHLLKEHRDSLKKFWVAVATALAVTVTVLPDGVTGGEWIIILLAFLNALGVYAVTNAPAGPTTPPTDQTHPGF